MPKSREDSKSGKPRTQVNRVKSDLSVRYKHNFTMIMLLQSLLATARDQSTELSQSGALNMTGESHWLDSAMVHEAICDPCKPIFTLT